jgi:hypothetical protein
MEKGFETPFTSPALSSSTVKGFQTPSSYSPRSIPAPFLTDIARSKDPERTDYLISNWRRNRNTVEFLGIWEQLHNPGFNPIEFDGIKKQTGLNSYKISVKEWVQKTNAIGLKATAGRYGGTFAHPDIAFEFGMWISPEFKIYLVREFRRLKEDENDRLKLDWETSSFQLFRFSVFQLFPNSSLRRLESRSVGVSPTCFIFPIFRLPKHGSTSFFSDH